MNDKPRKRIAVVEDISSNVLLYDRVSIAGYGGMGMGWMDVECG